MLDIYAAQSPLPDEIEAAQEEIMRLRKQLIKQNEALAKAFEKAQLDKRSLMGQLSALEKRIKLLGAGNPAKVLDTLIQYFQERKSESGAVLLHWSLNGADGLLAEFARLKRLLDPSYKEPLDNDF
jgi:hypothetical protein